jgi:hypothetical protein
MRQSANTKRAGTRPSSRDKIFSGLSNHRRPLVIMSLGPLGRATLIFHVFRVRGFSSTTPAKAKPDSVR